MHACALCRVLPGETLTLLPLLTRASLYVISARLQQAWLEDTVFCPCGCRDNMLQRSRSDAAAAEPRQAGGSRGFSQ